MALIMTTNNPYKNPELFRRVISRVVGRRREIRAIIAALAAGKNILLEGPPGTSKSTILRAIAEESGVSFFIIEGSADLTPQKLIGIFNPSKVLNEGFRPEFFEPGPLVKAMLEGGILYIEEFNRMSEDAMNALIRAMDEREISIPRYGVVQAKPSFRVICAMNPYDDVGTSRISRAVLDRFCRLRLDYQSREEEIEIVKLRTGSRNMKLIELAVELARATRHHSALKMGSSVRGAIDMVLIAEELIRLRGGNLELDDLLDAAVMAMSSKVWVNDPEISPEDVIREILINLLMKSDHKVSILNNSSNSNEKKCNMNQNSHSETHIRDEENIEGISTDLLQHLADLARVAPRRVSIHLSNEPCLMLDILKGAIGRGDIRALELYGRVYAFLDKDLCNLARKYAIELILRIATRASLGMVTEGIIPDRFEWDSDDINLDVTLDKMIDHGVLTIDEIFVNKRMKKRKCFALMIDRSLSMAGYKLVLAALAGAIIAYAAGNYSGYAVLAFNTRVVFLKRIYENLSTGGLVNRILNLRAYGYTDIAKALREAYKELLLAKPERIIGILITDGEWTAGENPLKVATRFDRLYVLGVPSKWHGFARAIAEKGGGRYVLIRELRQVPEAIMNILKSEV